MMMGERMVLNGDAAAATLRKSGELALWRYAMARVDGVKWNPLGYARVALACARRLIALGRRAPACQAAAVELLEHLCLALRPDEEAISRAGGDSAAVLGLLVTTESLLAQLDATIPAPPDAAAIARVEMTPPSQPDTTATRRAPSVANGTGNAASHVGSAPQTAPRPVNSAPRTANRAPPARPAPGAPPAKRPAGKHDHPAHHLATPPPPYTIPRQTGVRFTPRDG